MGLIKYGNAYGVGQNYGFVKVSVRCNRDVGKLEKKMSEIDSWG